MLGPVQISVVLQDVHHQPTDRRDRPVCTCIHTVIVFNNINNIIYLFKRSTLVFVFNRVLTSGQRKEGSERDVQVSLTFVGRPSLRWWTVGPKELRIEK